MQEFAGGVIHVTKQVTFVTERGATLHPKART